MLRESQGHVRAWTFRYGFALLVFAAAALVRSALTPWLGHGFPYLLFFPAVMLASWRGGLGPGIATTLLGAGYSAYFFLGPINSLWVSAPADRISCTLFVIIGVAIAVLQESVRRADHRHTVTTSQLETATADVQRSQRRIQDLLDDVPGVVWEAWGHPDAASQRIDFISDHVEGMLGYTPQEWLQTPNFWLQVVHPEDRDRAAREAHEIFTRGGVGVSEFRWVGRDGRVVWVQAQSRVVHDEHGRPLGMRGVTMDITARKLLEQERQALLEQAQRLNQVRDEFLATLSHELRTPINAVLGWAQMLRVGAVTGTRATDALHAIERNAQAQTRLIEELLDVSRIVTGKFALEIHEFDLGTTIDAAVDAIRPAAAAKNITVRVVHPGRAGMTMRGDPHRLQQAIWNVLSNAVKFTPDGGLVTILTDRTPSEMQITVTDTGEGITGDALPFVFDRFTQADSTPTRAHAGLGLGLAIVRHIVELHGGHVEATSDGADRGAAFRLRLPFDPAAQPSQTESVDRENALRVGGR